jgi:hypothetical protein
VARVVLRSGRSRVGFPMRLLDFSIDLFLPAALWPGVDSNHLTEMSTRNPGGGGGKGQPTHKADNLTPICEPIV